MLAAPPFSASCGNVLQAACRTSYSASFGQEVAAAMLTALPLYTSCGNALRAACRTSSSPSSRQEVTAAMLAGSPSPPTVQCVAGSCRTAHAASFRQEVTSTMLAALPSSTSCGVRRRQLAYAHISKSSPSRCVSPAVAFTSKMPSQWLAETRRRYFLPCRRSDTALPTALLSRPYATAAAVSS